MSNSKKIIDSEVCVVCGQYCKKFLCNRDRKRFIIYKKHNIVALKPRRKVSKSQSKIYKFIKDIFKKPTFQEVIFPWEIFYRYDVVVPDIKLIVEYHGRQHFEFVKFFHKTKEGYERAKKVDRIKKQKALDHGYTFVEVNYKESDKQIKKKLKWAKNKIKKKSKKK